MGDGWGGGERDVSDDAQTHTQRIRLQITDQRS